MTVFQGTDYNRKDTSDDINKAANDITGKSSSLCFDAISHWGGGLTRYDGDEGDDD